MTNIIILRPEQSWGKRVQGEEVQPSGWQSPPLLPLFSHRGGTICDGDGDDDFTWKMVIESYIKSSTVAEDDYDSCDKYEETSD